MGIADKKQFYLLKAHNIIAAQENATHWLGRIVSNYTFPGEDFVPANEDSLVLPGLKIQSSKMASFDKSIQKTDSLKLKAMLLKLLGGKYDSHQSAEVGVQATEVRQYWLTDAEDVYQQLQQTAEVRTKLDQWLTRGGDRAYLIVGCMVANHLHFDDVSGSTRSGGPVVDLPVVAIAAAAGGVPLPIDGGLEGEVILGKTNKETTTATVKDRSIFAIQYRSLRRAFFTRERKVQVVFGPQGSRTFAGNDTTPTEKADEDHVVLGNSQMLDALQEAGEEDVILGGDFDDFSLIYGDENDDEGGEGTDDDEVEEEEEEEEEEEKGGVAD